MDFTREGLFKPIISDTTDDICKYLLARDACNPNARPDHAVHWALLSRASAGFDHSTDLQPTAPPPLCCLWLSDPQNARKLQRGFVHLSVSVLHCVSLARISINLLHSLLRSSPGDNAGNVSPPECYHHAPVFLCTQSLRRLLWDREQDQIFCHLCHWSHCPGVKLTDINCAGPR